MWNLTDFLVSRRNRKIKTKRWRYSENGITKEEVKD